MSRPYIVIVFTFSCALLGCQGAIEGASDPFASEREDVSGTPGDELSGKHPPGSTDPSGNGLTEGSGSPRSGEELEPKLFRCESEDPALPPPRVVRLDAAQYAKAIAVLFEGRSEAANRDRPAYEGEVPFGLANSADRFSTRARSYRVSEAEIEGVVTSAAALGTQLAQALAEPGASCLAEDEGFAACMESLIADKGAILYGRPLREEEIDAYLAAALDLYGSSGAMEAAALSFEALLRAPQFLFRSELGVPNEDGSRQLSSYEVASALSYTLTQGPPDQELWEAAERGELHDKDEIERQVERLLSPLEDNPSIARFLREYMRYDQAQSVAKDPEEYELHNPELLQDDTRRFLRDVLAEHGRQEFLSALLTVDSGVARAATQDSYGLSGLEAEPGQVTFPPGERAGILSQPSWLVAHSESEKNDPIRRGLFIRESLLCGQVPPIPVDDIPPLDVGEDATLREVLVQHREEETCAGCHRLMDPLGFPFETYDHFGRFRTMEGPNPVDATGEIEGTIDQDGPVDGPIEFAEQLAKSATVRRCFVAHAFEYWRGMHWRDAPDCGLAEADREYDESEGDLIAMIAAFFRSDTFLLRDTEAS